LLIRLAAAIALVAGHAAAQNHSDIWWNPNESGWGITIADHETQLFAVWYTYRADGRPVWFVIPGGTFTQGKRLFQGDIYQTTGPSNAAPSFDASLVTRRVVGTASFDFAPPGLAAGTALFTYSMGGATQTKQIYRQPFGNAAPRWGTDLTDIWWNAAESGWGLTLAQHGNNVFGVWFTYDTDGEPLWVVMPGVTFSSATAFSGELYTTTGPHFAATPFDANRVTRTLAGSATVIVDPTTAAAPTGKAARSAVFQPLFQGRSSTKLISPQPFGSSPPPPQIDAPGSCSGIFNGRLTLPSHCVPAGTRSFTARITISGVDWTQAGDFAGDVRIEDFLLSVASSEVVVYQGVVVSAPCDIVTRETLEGEIRGRLAVDGVGTFVGTGTATFALGAADFDFRVPANINVNGHVSYDYTLEARYRGLGEFSCIPQ
jgi:hypothetical protein